MEYLLYDIQIVNKNRIEVKELHTMWHGFICETLYTYVFILERENDKYFLTCGCEKGTLLIHRTKDFYVHSRKRIDSIAPLHLYLAAQMHLIKPDDEYKIFKKLFKIAKKNKMDFCWKNKSILTKILNWHYLNPNHELIRNVSLDKPSIIPDTDFENEDNENEDNEKEEQVCSNIVKEQASQTLPGKNFTRKIILD